MKIRRYLKSLLVLLLCAALVLPYLPISASAAKLSNFDTGSDFSGVKLSLIGDSISTYYGVSNSSTYNPLYLSTSEATFGTYYGNTSHGDYAEFSSVKRADTWWQQTVDTLGMDLLVNNAWSGSFTLVDTGQSNTTEYPAAGYKTRCVNMHKGSTKPDIICVYMGTNDVAYYSTQPIGSKANVDTASERSALYTSVNSYKTPSTAIEAYFIMLSRMLATYPSSEIYCILPTICLNTMSSGRTNALNSFNEGVRYLVDYFAGTGKTIYLVDLPAYSGLVDVDVVRSYYYCNNVHPSVAGMDWITSCVVSEILEHTQKGKQTSTTCKVTYNLTDAFSPAGLPRQTVVGKSFKLDMQNYLDNRDMNIAVTMKDANGKQVTIPGGGVSGDSVYIPSVTGDITVTVTDKPRSYQWEAHSDAFTSVPGNGYTYNNTTLIGGSYDSSSSVTMSTVQYSLGKPVILQHDKPWTLEWKSGGSTYAGGIMLFNGTADSSDMGNQYIHITQSNVFFGYRDSVGYNNSGVAWTTIASKLGSSAGADIRNEMLEFKVVNVPNGTNNKLWLYVNGVQIGTMDSSKAIGGSSTHASVGDINLSGKDFVFNYLGSASHSWQNCSVEYIRVYENGALEPVTDFKDYRWEASGSSFTSVEDDTFTENALTQLSGSVTNGTFTSALYDIHDDVVLMHDKAWSIEWTSSGTWIGDSNGSMLMAGDLYYKGNSSHYIYRRQNSIFVGIGEWRDGVHNNYVCKLEANGIDGTVYHKYALCNEPVFSGGQYVSNMVYLYVDDAKVGPLNHYYTGSTDTGTTVDWLNGRDLVFSTIGTEVFTVGGCTMEYLQVKTGCAHDFGSWTVKTAATCTAEGTQTRTCSLCGEVQTEAIAALGHSYDGVTYETTCQTIAHTCYTCSRCGDSYNVYNADSMGPWQETKPDVEENLIETGTQYRYRDYETTTSYETSLSGYEQLSSEWIKSGSGSVQYVNSWPSGFSTSSSLYTQYNKKSSKVTASVTDTTKTVIDSDKVTGYLYYHWCYSNSYYSQPSKTGSYTTFHAYYSTSNPSNYTCDTSDMSYKTAHSTCSNSDWFFVTEVSTQSYTKYNNLFTYGRWGNWSDWSDTPITGSDLRQVEERTVYRTVATEFAPHNYVNNVCTVCGNIKKVQDYYLFGYINGGNYGCEENFENLGEYKFVNGQLTAIFDQDSYVAVKTADNENWYMTDGWQGNSVTSVTLYNTKTLSAADKLFVPGGVELIFTLVDNGNDTYSLSYEPAVCEHSYQSKVTTPATCTTAGVTTYTCTKCGDSYTSSISTLGHSYIKSVVAPSCTTAGYTVYNCSVCGHSYQADQQTALGHSYKGVVTAPTCTAAGYTTYTCSACGDSYVGDRTAAAGHSYKGVVTAPTCTAAGYTTYTCSACGDSYKGDDTAALGHQYKTAVTEPTCTAAGYTTYTCRLCGSTHRGTETAALGHSYENGKCTRCDAADPDYVPDYYLVGYINGANYGCEEDYENMGDYRFVNGQLTATFQQDSYVFLKTSGNADWFMTQSYCSDTTGTFFSTSTGAGEKMLVPGGVEITFTLTDNGDGSLTLSYVEEVVESVKPTIKLKYPTLVFEDEILMNVYYEATDLEDVVEMGLITYSQKVTDYHVGNAEAVVPGYVWSDADQFYYSTTEGIAPKCLGDTIYFAVYYKLADGTYGYTGLAGYSPKTYAYNQLKTGSSEMKPLVVAMLKYGAAAQNYFTYNTANMVDATLTADQLGLIDAYSSAMMNAVVQPSSAKLGEMVNNGGYTRRYPTISFEGAFCINYYFLPNTTPATDITMYIWNQADYNAASALSKGNATQAITMELTNSGEYLAVVEDIAAKDLDKGIYVSFCYSDGTTEYCSGVIGYSIGTYCVSQAAKTGTTLADLAAATAVYGYYAKELFYKEA